MSARWILLSILVQVAGATAQEPGRAVSVTYDISVLSAKPELLRHLPKTTVDETPRLRALPLAQRGLLVAKVVAGQVGIVQEDAIDVHNGNRLIIRTTPAKHAEIDQLLKALQRIGDIQVSVESFLFEVDETFHAAVKNMKPVDFEEQEKRLLGLAKGGPDEMDKLLGQLGKQKPIQTGDVAKTDDGLGVTLLARHRAATFLPSPDQLLRGDKRRQVMLEGVSLTADLRVSSDRRFVRLRLHETATSVGAAKKVKAFAEDGKDAEAVLLFLKETRHTTEFEVPDGGSMLSAVQHRPQELLEKKRAWVLMVRPRIHIEEEERMFHKALQEEIAAALVADILTNPALKANRDLFGTPGDKRFALVDSPAWAWKKDVKVDGFVRAEAMAAGKRLLGIRVDKSDDEMVHVTLHNAGGSENGAALGGGMLRYRIRETEKGRRIELAEGERK